MKRTGDERSSSTSTGKVNERVWWAGRPLSDADEGSFKGQWGCEGEQAN